MEVDEKRVQESWDKGEKEPKRYEAGATFCRLYHLFNLAKYLEYYHIIFQHSVSFMLQG